MAIRVGSMEDLRADVVRNGLGVIRRRTRCIDALRLSRSLAHLFKQQHRKCFAGKSCPQG